ncbi:hypothetical protein BDR26DRAFT_885995 [Obelidium mucronatum]|nr:hypothetical protein BDR26DRAFT_885995 [Obelidium mucronatum]
MVDASLILYGPNNASNHKALCLLSCIVVALIREYSKPKPTGEESLDQKPIVLTQTILALVLFSLVEASRVGSAIGHFKWTCGALAFQNRLDWWAFAWIFSFIASISYPNERQSHQHNTYFALSINNSRGFLSRSKVNGAGAAVVLFLLANVFKLVEIKWAWMGALAYGFAWVISLLLPSPLLPQGKTKPMAKTRKATDDAAALYLISSLWFAVLFWIDSTEEPKGGIAFSSFLVLVYALESSFKGGLLAAGVLWSFSKLVGPGAVVMVWCWMKEKQ